MVLAYTYTGDGQLYSVTETLNDTSTLYLYQYDTLGNLVGSEKRVGGSPVLRTYHSYNDDNKLSAQGWQIGSDSFTQTYNYGEWDGNLSSIVLSGNDSSDITVSYTYDTLRRLATVSNGVFTSTYSYYDNAEAGTASPRLKSIVHNGVNYSGKTVECNYTYEYDDNGNITSAAFGNRTQTYEYDSNNQLIRENNDRRQYTQTWEYDAFGNILSTSKYAYTTGALGEPTSTVTYGYTDSDWGDLLTEYNNQTIDYDNIGNPVSVTDAQGNLVKSYTWENGRQLKTLTNSKGNWTYTYDAGGMRTGRTNGSTTYEYIYAGDKLVRMIRSTASVTDVVDFGYAGNQLATMTYNGVTYYYVLNGQGDVIGLTDNTGKMVIGYIYSAYGIPTPLKADETLTPILKNLNPFMYRGYVYDIETSLYYLQSRYYDPELGRFINADAYASTGQGILGNNMFAYCCNNPVSYHDPHGTAMIQNYLQEDTQSDFEYSPLGGGLQTQIAFGTLTFAAALYAVSVCTTTQQVTQLSMSSHASECYSVYFLSAQNDPTGKIVYVGRVLSSNIDARMLYHRSKGRRLETVITGLTYEECRAIEQVGMVYYHTINSQNDLMNKIRGVSPKNRKRGDYYLALMELVTSGMYPECSPIPASYWMNLGEEAWLNGSP